MEAQYHQQLCRQTLGDHFSPQALEAVIAANIRQDGLFTGLVGHPEFHFDDNHIDESWTYAAAQRQIVLDTLTNGEPTLLAWQAFGRQLHTVQDFYAHTSYVHMWAAGHTNLPPVEEFDGLDQTLIEHPDLFTAKVYYPIEALTYYKIFRPLMRRILPADSHARMNLDSPVMGELFFYAMEGARQRTQFELS
ncbi:hypothetical protein ACFLYP_03985, partial [Chloroflexota bacterium]